MSTIESIFLIGFLVATMLSFGLSLAVHEILEPLRDLRLVMLMMLLNFILAPGFALLLTRLIPLERGYAAGLLLLGTAAGAPFLPHLAKVARCDLHLAVASVLFLTAGTLFFMPIALPLMVPGLNADAWQITRPLLLMIVLPLAFGMVAKVIFVDAARAIAPPLSKLGTLCLVLLSVLLVIHNAREFLALIGTGAISVMLLHIGMLAAAGWLLGIWKPEAKGILCLGAGARNFGAAFVPASGLHDPNVTSVLTASAIVSVLGLFPLAGWMRQSTAPAQSTAKVSEDKSP